MRRVLIVDDSRAVRDEIQAALEPYGLEIRHAENGAVGLKRACSEPVDLLFLDVNMPVLDGPNMLRLLRAQGIAAHVILVTSGAATSLVASTIRLGAADFITKPFSAEALRAVTARVLGLDVSRLRVKPARVLVQHPDRAVAAGLRRLLPAHVAVDEAALLADALELAERHHHPLVLLDAAVLEGEVAAAAGMVRQRSPAAGIFALAAAPPGPPWSPEGHLDGVLPRALDEALVRELLVPSFLRTLVFPDGPLLRAAGFEGEAAGREAYFTALARDLEAALTRELVLVDVTVDLVWVPARLESVARLVLRVRDAFTAAGAAPAFRVPEAVRAALVASPALAGILIS